MSDHMKEAERLIEDFGHCRVAESILIRCGTPREVSCAKEKVESTRAALLAHIQRGAVPVYCTPTEHEGRIVYEHTSEPIPNADGFVLYAASADQFRTAAKMMAVQPACMTCSGHGMVGGLLPNGGGYQADPCPACTAPAPAAVPMPDVFMYGVKEPDGGAWMQEVCVSTLKGDVDELVDDLNDGRDDADTRYTPVSLVTMEDAERYGAACRDAGEAAGYARGLAEAGDRIRRGRKILDAALRGEVKP